MYQTAILSSVEIIESSLFCSPTAYNLKTRLVPSELRTPALTINDTREASSNLSSKTSGAYRLVLSNELSSSSRVISIEVYLVDAGVSSKRTVAAGHEARASICNGFSSAEAFRSIPETVPNFVIPRLLYGRGRINRHLTGFACTSQTRPLASMTMQIKSFYFRKHAVPRSK